MLLNKCYNNLLNSNLHRKKIVRKIKVVLEEEEIFLSQENFTLSKIHSKCFLDFSPSKY